jgi:hypothetical protein
MDDLASTSAKYQSAAIRPQPGDNKLPASKGLYVMPYIKGGKRGILLVNKRNNDVDVSIAGATGGTVTVVGVTGATPGLSPPVARQISKHGALGLGPFGVGVAVAVITAIEGA